jgi:hypothetical protein
VPGSATGTLLESLWNPGGEGSVFFLYNSCFSNLDFDGLASKQSPGYKIFGAPRTLIP